jgi:hypothetical protein
MVLGRARARAAAWLPAERGRAAVVVPSRPRNPALPAGPGPGGGRWSGQNDRSPGARAGHRPPAVGPLGPAHRAAPGALSYAAPWAGGGAVVSQGGCPAVTGWLRLGKPPAC